MVVRLPPAKSRSVYKNPTTSSLQIVVIVAFLSFVVIGIVLFLILWALFPLLAMVFSGTGGSGTGGW
jgi:hypothetical protein